MATMRAGRACRPHSRNGIVGHTNGSRRIDLQTILVVEDDARIAEIVDDYLRHAGFDVVRAGTGEDALVLASARPPESGRARSRSAAHGRVRGGEAASRRDDRADHHVDGESRGIRSDARLRHRRRRLRHEAVQSARAGGARQGRFEANDLTSRESAAPRWRPHARRAPDDRHASRTGA